MGDERKSLPGWPGYSITKDGILWEKRRTGWQRCRTSGGIYVLRSETSRGMNRKVRCLRGSPTALATRAWGAAGNAATSAAETPPSRAEPSAKSKPRSRRRKKDDDSESPDDDTPTG